VLRFFYVIFANLWRIFYYLYRMEQMAKHPERYTLEERYAFDVKVVNIVMKTGRITTQCFGKEHLPQGEGCLIVANHQGKFDALAVFHTHSTPVSFVMDEAKSGMVFTNQFLRIVDGVGLKKDDLRQSLKALKEVGRRISQGRSYLIFPEGGYTDNHNQMGEFLPGAFKAAYYAKAPVVPVALVDTYKPFSVNSLRPVDTQIHYLEPIPYEEYQNLSTGELANLCRERIGAAIEEATGEKQRAVQPV
jgi:1-acyl-sn-glycerol-3-phosphate acyltransferase